MRTLLSLALLAVALPASAQATFGVKLGVNAANVSISDEDELFGTGDGVDKKARLGFVAGVTADVPLSPMFSFRPEVLYTQKGYAIDFDVDEELFGQAINGTITNKIDYLEVPLLLAYRFPTSSALEIALEAGPTLAYKLSTGISCSGNFEDIGEDCEDFGDEDDDGVRDFDLGGAIGATVGAGPFGVGIRYTNSILSIATDEAPDDNNDFTVRNQVFSATLHYRFGASGRRY